MSTPHEILEFWFQGIDDQTPGSFSAMPFKMWFMKDEENDRLIKEKFEEDIKKAAIGEYKDWEEDVRGRLAIILLFDQFCRNIYRGTPGMFAHDDKALALTRQTIDEGKDKELMLVERMFLYLPLEHSEDIKMQELSLQKFQELVDEAKNINPANVGYYKSTFDYSKKHYEIIKRFNRFPHRNNNLGRPSSNEESAFLARPGSSF